MTGRARAPLKAAGVLGLGEGKIKAWFLTVWVIVLV